jgi:hypothetical protein
MDDNPRPIWRNLWLNAKWLLSILGLFWPAPALPLEQTKPLIYLARFIVTILIACVIYLTNRLNRHYHAKTWLKITLASLLVFLGGWFLNDTLRQKWVCVYRDGRTFIMGSKLSPNGEQQVPKAICQGGCENLIHNCGHDSPENIWLPSSIALARRVLVLIYFLMLPVFVLCVMGVIQIRVCSNKPDPRPEFDGTWEGAMDHAVRQVKLSVPPDKKFVSGTLGYKIGPAEVPMNNTSIEKSYFEGDSLLFSVMERGELWNYRMTIINPSSNNAVLDRRLAKQEFRHHCDLTKCQTAEAGQKLDGNSSEAIPNGSGEVKNG